MSPRAVELADEPGPADDRVSGLGLVGAGSVTGVLMINPPPIDLEGSTTIRPSNEGYVTPPGLTPQGEGAPTQSGPVTPPG